MSEYRLFFSHGGEDTYVVDKFLKPKLEATGALVFVDVGKIQYGDDFRRIILKELKLCDELLVLLTPTSIHRPWVFAELGASLVREIRVVVIRYGITEEQLRLNGVLSLLGTHKFLVMDDFDTYISELTCRVNGRRNG